MTAPQRWVPNFDEMKVNEKGFLAADLGGVYWSDAHMPSLLHRCRAQSVYINKGDFIERCACGAIRYDGRGWWRHKNSSRAWRVRYPPSRPATRDIYGSKL